MLKEKKYFLLKDLNEEDLQSFLSFINDDADSHKIILVDSTGGYNDIAETISYIINLNPEQFTLVAYGTAYSAAFDIFIYAKCNKEYMYSSTGGIHLSEYSLSTRDLNNVDSKSHFIKKSLAPENNKRRLKMYNFLTPTQLKALKSGKEIYFTSKEFKEIIENYEQNSNIQPTCA